MSVKSIQVLANRLAITAAGKEVSDADKARAVKLFTAEDFKVVESAIESLDDEDEDDADDKYIALVIAPKKGYYKGRKITLQLFPNEFTTKVDQTGNDFNNSILKANEHGAGVKTALKSSEKKLPSVKKHLKDLGYTSAELSDIENVYLGVTRALKKFYNVS